VKKIIFWGDAMLTGPAGYAELLGDHLYLHHPRAEISLSVVPASAAGDGSTLAEALREAPLHAIGRDPDLLYLGFGPADLKAGKSPEEMLRILRDLVALVLQKTRAHLALPLLVSCIFPDREDRERVRAVNAGLAGLAGSRVALVDLESKVEAFLRAHLESEGDQRALHLDTGRLTPMGQLLLAHHAFALVPWPDLRPAAQPVPF
jgi:hypothetical protein